ncbi:nuclear transport factor 2 family protein [Congregibacter brevis]|uniref:Nuclear transport factor 2 family protein n=1 Tax=Congregibacter brevis TaxID=3081201 RepID=A0ABZ0IDQ0_9GAMM|nr:nuclear transport factor 2 family protein [Congregibacter sp. IMCC45268]
MQIRFKTHAILLAQYFFLAAFSLHSLQSAADDRAKEAINGLLDDFHQAAADADKERYLGYFSADGVFMGTDDWERWPLPEFTVYVGERFSGGTGWTYVSEERFITLGPTEASAWFDEIMVSKRWGRFRGTGVLLKENGVWKIAHYSLTALVPNERFADVAEVATEGFLAREAEQDSEEEKEN